MGLASGERISRLISGEQFATAKALPLRDSVAEWLRDGLQRRSMQVRVLSGSWVFDKGIGIRRIIAQLVERHSDTVNVPGSNPGDPIF